MSKKIDRGSTKMDGVAIAGVFAEYAAYYNILYRDKDYAGETKFILQLMKKLLSRDSRNLRILDLACGTGRHAMELAQLGYAVEGSDVSKDMIEIAVRESKRKNLKITYYNESFQTIGRIGKKYDVILSMFSAINYLSSYEDLSKALQNIYTLLDKKGIFIFDFWNGDAVIDSFSPLRVKRVSKKGKEVLRISRTTIDRLSQRATVKFHFILLEEGRITKEFDEEHVVRYFFLQEMSDLLEANNFKVILRCPFMEVSRIVSPSDWNVTYVARKTT
jgi:2-polyprenyl-3-methyl-5-hydroxy-6-metoxy-1,4-benzoquinol methylase